MAKRAIIILALVLVVFSAVFAGEIHQRVMSGDMSRVKAILDKNPGQVNAVEEQSGNTPVIFAACQHNKEMVRFLISRGAMVDIFLASITGETALAKALLDIAPSLAKARDRNGQTPLHWASNKGHRDVVLLLIARGADVNAKDGNGWTPLQYAREMEQKEVAEILKKHGAR